MPVLRSRLAGGADACRAGQRRWRPSLPRPRHRLKGTVAYLGAAPALEATRRVEDIGRSGDLSAAPAALEKLAMELDGSSGLKGSAWGR